jgi:O-antigen/teichoic acid export membrane protein
MLQRNVIANYLGQAWTAAIGIAVLPIYIKYLGIESYGLVGLFTVLQAALIVLDMGLTPTLGREMARFTSGGHSAQSIRDVLRTIEVITAGLAVATTCAIWVSSDWLAARWLRAETLSPDVVKISIGVMGLVVALRLLEALYRSAIIGLQKQVALNIAGASVATIRALGAVGVLHWLSSSVLAFFVWQACVSIASLLILACFPYFLIKRAPRAARFSLESLRPIWGFAAGMFVTSTLALLLTQADKILLSRTLTLTAFGYYSFAATVAGALYMLMSPLTQAVYPKLCAQHAAGDAAGFTATFHKAAQAMTVAAGSAAIVLALFSEALVRLWTRDENLARECAALITLLVIGNMLHGFAGIPYYAQLALGWTRLALVTNAVSVLVIVPAILWSVPRYGSQGAAWTWFALTAGYVLISAHAFFARYPYIGKLRWYWQDLAAPLFGAAAPPLLVLWAMHAFTGQLHTIAALILASVGSVLGAVMLAPHVRATFLRDLAKISRRVVHE